jgi:beta-lactamase class A
MLPMRKNDLARVGFLPFLLTFSLLVSCTPKTQIQVTGVEPTPTPTAKAEDPSKFAGVVPLGSPITAVEPELKALIKKYSFLEAGMYFLDLENGNFLDVEGEKVFPAASTIKLPLLIAFFQDVDAGKIKLDEKLKTTKDLITDGAGFLQYQPVGKEYTALDTARLMISISDNTATNMIIDRLGGLAAVNERFRSWGLKDTVANNLLSDLKGTNTTSSKDLARVLASLVNDKIVSPESKEKALEILRNCRTRSLLPSGLGKGAKISHKTGDIGFIIGDAGVITMPSGKRYLGAIFVKRKYNDPRGRDFIRQVSQIVYKYEEQQHKVASTR